MEVLSSCVLNLAGMESSSQTLVRNVLHYFFSLIIIIIIIVTLAPHTQLYHLIALLPTPMTQGSSYSRFGSIMSLLFIYHVFVVTCCPRSCVPLLSLLLKFVRRVCCCRRYRCRCRCHHRTCCACCRLAFLSCVRVCTIYLVLRFPFPLWES